MARRPDHALRLLRAINLAVAQLNAGLLALGWAIIILKRVL